MSSYNNVSISVGAVRSSTGEWDAIYLSTDTAYTGHVHNIQHKKNVVRECIRHMTEHHGILKSRVRIKGVSYQ